MTDFVVMGDADVSASKAGTGLLGSLVGGLRTLPCPSTPGGLQVESTWSPGGVPAAAATANSQAQPTQMASAPGGFQLEISVYKLEFQWKICQAPGPFQVEGKGVSY